MDIIEVTGGQGGNAFLVAGEEKTALVDCGMAYCADKLIDNLNRVLKGRPLDYLLISHSHYDHIGASPYLRIKWPSLKVLGADHARQILTRQTALETIRALSCEAARFYGSEGIKDYDDKLLKVDESIGNGDVVELGAVTIKVLETTGHTKCSLSFLLDSGTLFTSESTGCMSKSGRIFPAFITSAANALASIDLCEKVQPKFIVSPHYGFVSQSDKPHYWENCRAAIRETQDFIIAAAERRYTEEQILAEYELRFRDEEYRREQPLAAFRLNNRHMIKVILKEKTVTG